MTVISASLSHLQNVILQKDDLQPLLEARSDVANVLDCSMIGCMMLFSCLDEEIVKVQKGAQTLNWRGRAKLVWSHDKLRQLLDDLRGHQGALSTLITLLSASSIDEMKRLLKRGRNSIQEAETRTQRLRMSHPESDVPRSIYGHDRQSRQSIRSFDPWSVSESITSQQPSELNFDFDDEIVNSHVYRRMLAKALKRHKADSVHAFEGDLIDLSDDVTIRMTSEQEAPSQTFEDLRMLSDFPAEQTEGVGTCDVPATKHNRVDSATNNVGHPDSVTSDLTVAELSPLSRSKENLYQVKLGTPFLNSSDLSKEGASGDGTHQNDTAEQQPVHNVALLKDRWTVIRENAVKRAAARAAEKQNSESRPTQIATPESGESSDEESIESRAAWIAARIKTRVAELVARRGEEAARPERLMASSPRAYDPAVPTVSLGSSIHAQVQPYLNAKPIAHTDLIRNYNIATKQGENLEQGHIAIDKRSNHPPPPDTIAPYQAKDVLFSCTSLHGFIANSRIHEGSPFLSYSEGEVFNVFKQIRPSGTLAVLDELWLAQNNDDWNGTIGWIWHKDFVKLP